MITTYSCCVMGKLGFACFYMSTWTLNWVFSNPVPRPTERAPFTVCQSVREPASWPLSQSAENSHPGRQCPRPRSLPDAADRSLGRHTATASSSTSSSSTVWSACPHLLTQRGGYTEVGVAGGECDVCWTGNRSKPP